MYIALLIISNLGTAGILFWHFHATLRRSKLLPYYKGYLAGGIVGLNVVAQVKGTYEEKFARDLNACDITEED